MNKAIATGGSSSN